MSDPTQQQPVGQTGAAGQNGAAEVKIDRLVLDIPGLAPEQAHTLATDIAERLSRIGLAGEHPAIGITLGPIGRSQAELAARIVAALRERLV
jgi:hypothetical protein